MLEVTNKKELTNTFSRKNIDSQALRNKPAWSVFRGKVVDCPSESVAQYYKIKVSKKEGKYNFQIEPEAKNNIKEHYQNFYKDILNEGINTLYEILLEKYSFWKV